VRAPGQPPPAPVDLSLQTGEGPLWGLASEDLNATLLFWGPGAGVVEHVNDERDVLLIVIDGAGVATIDGEPHPLRPHDALLIERGTRRQIQAAANGLRYVSIHRRRDGLQIESLRPTPIFSPSGG
jgi:quercetin dioxygenase-like cupin family protein